MGGKVLNYSFKSEANKTKRDSAENSIDFGLYSMLRCVK